MDIQSTIQQLIITAPPFLFALTCHELAHGYTAWKLGDSTAKDQGRLTMNPLKHLDPFGVLAFFIIKVGWAKPVPVNPKYFRNPQKGMLLTALAGPVANMLLAICSVVLLRLFIFLPDPPAFIGGPVFAMLVASIWINVMLAVFNLLPVPPLDGSKILMGVLPAEQAASYARLEPYSIILLLVLFYMGIIGKVIMPVINFTVGVMVG